MLEPLVFCVGAAQLTVAVPKVCGGAGAAATVIVNAASAALVVPSLTVITIPASVPTSPVPGVPLIWPVEMLKLAQLGLFCTLKLSVLPLALFAVGVNE
jgi:hypothetical protein